jgi:uncharacterized protein with PQ loop repeat
MSRYIEHCRRNNYYVDHMIQKWLLIGLVALEMLSIAVAVWALYGALDNVIEANTYRIHFHEDSNALPAFFVIGIKIIMGIGIVNFVAIVAADRIWAAYVNRIVRNLDRIMQAAMNFDFSAQTVERREHAVLDHAAGWHEDEATRLQRIRDAVRALPAQLPASQAERDGAATALRDMHDCVRRGE